MRVSNLLKKLIPNSALVVLSLSLITTASPAQASTFTRNSPTSAGLLPTGVSEVGGIVLDLIGANGTRVVSQLSANSLFHGVTEVDAPNITIGVQSGFNTSILSALGGGLKQAAIRFTLYDGDTSRSGLEWNYAKQQYEYIQFDNFDLNDNSLLVNGLNFGNWSAVNAQNTDYQGNAGDYGFSGGGFRAKLLDTAWFSTNDAGLLSDFYNSLVSSGQVTYELHDADPGDQYLDFKRGIAGDLIDVGQDPTIEDPKSVPEPSFGLGLLGFGVLGVSSLLKRKKSTNLAPNNP